MTSYSFKLKNPKNKSKVTPIFIQIAFKIGEEFDNIKFSTGFKVKPNDWNQGKQKSRDADLNEHLKKLEKKAQQIVLIAANNDIPLTKSYIKEKWNESKKIPILERKIEFEEAFKEYLESLKNKLNKATIGHKKNALKKYQGFSTEYKIPLTFENITLSFYDKLLEYCYKKGFHRNHTGNMIKILKAFLNWATDRDYNTNMDFKKKAFKKLTFEPVIIYLTESELFQLYNTKIDDQHLSDTRDFFCFGCFTGLRFGDIKRLSPSNIITKELVIDGNKQKIDFIEIRTEKMDEILSQPLNRYAKEILDKHKGNNDLCFKMINENDTNLDIKKVFKEVKLHRMIQKNNFKGSEEIIERKPLSDLITFHISKKTFMTNFLARGGQLTTAMAMTGNKDYKTAKRYFKVVDELKAIESLKVFQ